MEQEQKGSYYIQCKAEHAKNTLHEYYFSDEYQNILKEEELANNPPNENSNENENGNGSNNENTENNNENSKNDNGENKNNYKHSAAAFFGSFMIVASINNTFDENDRVCFY